MYPRYNGFAILGANGVTYSLKTADGYGRPAAASTEYISFKGGPGTGSGGTLSAISPNPFNNKKQVSNIYDKTIYKTAGLPSDYGTGTRESNLKSNFDTGVTVEFWLKKQSFLTASTSKEVIFDLWNSNLSSSTSYGRLTIELTGAATGSPFTITAQSGTVSSSIFAQSIGSSITTGSLEAWHHYAFRFYNSGSSFMAKLYVDGKINDTKTYSSRRLGEISNSTMLGRIGALMTSPSGSSAIAGDGTLSASIDDFRFWKTNRNARQIGINYFTAVGGGANTDISNADLGVYYKFNEGITNNSSVDSIVLDYAGRVTNAVWTGYDTSSRNTGSAIILASAAEREYKDPVVRRNHPNFIQLRSDLYETGSSYDMSNNAAFLNYAPSWVLDAHDNTENKNLKNLSHIVGTYFDKIYLLGKELPKIRHLNYTTASNSPVPFASHMPTSMGLYVPELFVDASILENLYDRTDTELFESKLNEIKNLIYLNLYNNITNIYKSKGTEKSIRNVFRCFNIDDSLIKMNVYNKNATYEVKTNLKQAVIEKSMINFNNAYNTEAVVYQAADSTNPESRGYISGSTGDGSATGPEEYNGATIEADIMFPRFFLSKDKFARNFQDVSLFGIHTVDTGSADSLTGVDTKLLAGGVDYANFQVFAVRDEAFSDNVYFKLTSSNSPYPLPELTSSVYFDVYDESRWNISVRIKPKDYPNAGMVSGSLSNSYDVIFKGVNADLGVVKNSFELTGTLTNTVGAAFLRAPKRMYVGARRENITGAIQQKTDVLALACRYWTKYLDNTSLELHAHGEENVGVTDSYRMMRPIDPFIGTSANTELTNKNTLALSWNFDNVTASTATGTFTVNDYSSGSYSLRQNYGWLGKIVGYQHNAKGFGFAQSSNTVANKERISSFSFVDPEQAAATNMINILSEDDEVLEFYETLPNYVFTVEKSMYAAISEEMVNFFAGAVDFNNVIGEPVNRYRSRYKALEKLRQSFFERVTTTSEVEKYVEYYKWFDDAISTILSQLVPASADFVEDVLNVVESHTLERNKYETKFPTLEARDPVVESATHGYTEKSYLYRLGRSTVPSSPRDTTKNIEYWKRRAERNASEITSGDATIDSQREIYRKIINSNPHLSRSASTLFDSATSTGYLQTSYARRNFIKNFSETVNVIKPIKGGVNFEDSKNIHFIYNSVHPVGPINTSGSLYVPLNVLLSFMEDLVKEEVNNDPKLVTEKTKRYLKVLSGRDYEEGQGYSNAKSTISFPFNIISSSISTGYQRQVADRISASIMLTNLHNDVYGPDMEVPMQGPFTNYAVGGHQSRHIKLNKGSDSSTTRPEAWRILLGTCPGIPSGAIGLVGPDYPDPSTGLSGSAAYPYRPHQKAVYYRDMTAKRPVNIKNIRLTTGSTILGNYSETYQYVQTVGAFNNPRHFVDQQPNLPQRVFVNNATSSMFVRTFLDMHRQTNGHNTNVDEYSTAYLTGNMNKSVIINRFSAPGGIETLTKGYQDFRSSEFSVYNGLNNRNLSVRKPWQASSGTISTPATLGDTTNIQVYDIHGKDYGLTSHLSRHTARFGRDSLFETNPGVSYEELPGFHKVHRNNLTRKELCDYTTWAAGNRLTNTQGFSYDPDVNRLATIWNSDTTATSDLRTAIQDNSSEGFSWSGWIKFGAQKTNQSEAIVQIGTYGGAKANPGISGSFFQISKIYESGAYKIKVKLATQQTGNSASDGSRLEWTWTSGADLRADWNHYVVSWTQIADGSLNTTAAKRNLTIYVNGVSQSVALDAGSDYAFYDGDANFIHNLRSHASIDVAGTSMMLLGGLANGGEILSASIDEYTFWTKPLDSTEAQELYNSGTPCDVTASTTYTSATVDLWDWIRFEARGGDSQANINNANPGIFDASNRIQGFKNAFKGVPLTTNGINNDSFFITDVKAGCGSSTTVIQGVCDKGTFDNFYVQHQIPRSSKQYSWIKSSLESDNGWVGFTPKDFLVKQSKLFSSSQGDKYVPVYNFASASDYGTYYKISTDKVFFGSNQERLDGDADRVQHLPVDFVGLNTIIYEPITASSNTLGYPTKVRTADSHIEPYTTTEKPYLNAFYIDGETGTETGWPARLGTPVILNSILLNRNGPYGWPSWKPLRQANHPIIRNERATNTITVVGPQGNDDDLVTHKFAPVSNRGKPNMVSFNIGNNSQAHTFKVTDENERIYYNSVQMDNQFAPPFNTFVTPGEQLMAVARSGQNKINWVVYHQQLFPSIKNEFVSSSNNKVNYDNLFWRRNRTDRNTVNTVYERPTMPSGSYTAENAFGIYVSQSCWPLDAPSDFLTRKTCFHNSGSGTDTTWTSIGPIATLATASAGQLQNAYMGLMTGSFSRESIDSAGSFRGGYQVMTYAGGIGPLYARKHVLQSRFSVRNPNGPELPFFQLTGAYTPGDVSASFAFRDDPLNSYVDVGGGEAQWEAGQQAGYIGKFRGNTDPYTLDRDWSYGRDLYGEYGYRSAASLQAWWRFNESSSLATGPRDSSGRGRHGTFPAATEVTTFLSGTNPSPYIQDNCASFFTTASVDIGTGNTWDAIIGNNTGGGSTQQMTIGGWFFKTGDGGGGFGRIVSFSNGDIVVYSNTTDTILMQLKWSGGSGFSIYTTKARAITKNTWFHLAVSYDANSASNEPKFYINGVQVYSERSGGSTPSGGFSGIGTNDCIIGDRASTGRNWDGYMADFAIWNSILTDKEIEAIYEQRKADYGIISAPSQPWFTDYETYRYDLKLKAQGYSVVPEFRISEHIDDFLLDDGSPNRYVGLNLEIPHVAGANSEEDPTFFTTYTNSEFLKDFLRIKNTSLLNAKEIRISCTGAIRFNPYKGFYPAQRTVQMVEEFKDSYVNNMMATSPKFSGLPAYTWFPGTSSFWSVLAPGLKQFTVFGVPIGNATSKSRFLKPLTDTLFSPGILYNTIKSGMAVDYPIVTNPTKLDYQDDGRAQRTGTTYNTSASWTTTFNPAYQVTAQGALDYQPKYSFFDTRLPFETMLEPEKYLTNRSFYDMEANPYMQAHAVTASFIKNDFKNDYKKMANNFFGSVPTFFLENEEFTSIKSALNTDTFKFKGTETYMMRVVLNRSTTGPRTYEHEIDGFGRIYSNSAGVFTSSFGLYGGRPILFAGATSGGGTIPTGAAGYPIMLSGAYNIGLGAASNTPAAYYEIPQDPIYNPSFAETFTMYSRPSAFGPDLQGRPGGGAHLLVPTTPPVAAAQNVLSGLTSGALDSHVGINPAYTPPYYDGEAWVDLIFRPNSGSTYTLKDIMAETSPVCWRFDPGPRRCFVDLGGPTSGFSNALIPDYANDADGNPISYLPYGGSQINLNSMQLTSSFNLFGLEREQFVEVDKFGNVSSTRPGTTVGERWVIRTKFETPMLNFNSASVTYPHHYSQESTPKGMWHQFGKIPSSKEGVFIGIQDIPDNWLRNHYLVKDMKSIYNNFTNDGVVDYEVLSLADLVGFDTKLKQKIGKIKQKTTLREAVVAIPYIIEKPKRFDQQNDASKYRKSFIEIPKQRYEAAKNKAIGSAVGDSLQAAGASISKQIQKMERYIFPPQLDFVSNPEGAVDPFVMYIFEFKYELDKDDLSYIWQNLAPREYQKIEFQYESIAHELIDAELLNEETLEENQQLRWMVFKVKQKGQDSYWDKTDTQIAKRRDDSGSKQIASLNISQKSINDNLKMLNTYRYSHNWPYDYVSFVEMIKVNSEILFSDMPQLTQLRGEMQMADLSKSKVGTLKLQKMVNPVVAPFASSVLKFNPIGSLKGAKLSRAKKEFASKKARKMSKRTKKAGTAEMIPTSRKGGKKGKSRGSSGGGTGTDIMFGNNRGGNQGGGGSGGNSGGGSSY